MGKTSEYIILIPYVDTCTQTKGDLLRSYVKLIGTTIDIGGSVGKVKKVTIVKENLELTISRGELKCPGII